MRTPTARSAPLACLLGLTASMLAMGADAGRPAGRTFANTWNSHPRYLVQSTDAATARDNVTRVGGQVQRELPIINGVVAEVSEAQAEQLRALPGIRLMKDRALAPMGTQTPAPLVFTDGTAVAAETKDVVTNYPLLANAYPVWKKGITGKGVTIAVLDTGLWNDTDQKFDGRVLASIDIVASGAKPVTGDPYGHGTHVTSIAAGGATTKLGTFFGVAPGANLVIVRAFDGEGEGSYSNVIAGLNWIVANQQKYKIRVLNLSFGAPPQSNYWDDPLNQAVMAAWKAGIVVVVSAGNEGPGPMSIGVPGNVPYVITTGALSDNHTPYDPTDDKLASFSSTGPTYEGFVKPELVAPGGHMVGSMSYQSYLANIDPGSMRESQSLFTMSGTSQAAAVTSGVVALMLQANPALTPDNIKCKLIVSASPALTNMGTLAYSVFQQGAGLINAANAIATSALGCANQGLNVAADLAGTQHFGGPANQDASGNYYVMNMAGTTWGAPLTGDGYTWTRGYTWTKGYTWTQGYTWTNGYTWTKGYTWTQGYTWTKGYTLSQGYTWTKNVPWGTTLSNGAAKSASIDFWVPNE